MEDLLLHPSVTSQLETIIEHPVQTLLIIGPLSSGRRTLADYLISQILALERQPEDDPAVMLVNAANSGGIESARQIQKFLQLTTTGQSTYRRAVIIENSDQLTREAQNALLKTLEEPPADTIFILTVQQSSLLLPTVVSRAQQLIIKPTTLALATKYFSKSGSGGDKQIERAYLISRGSAGLMKSLLEADSQHELDSFINKAKQILAGTRFERLQMIEILSKDKEKMAQTLEGLSNVSRAALQSSLRSGNQVQVKRWLGLTEGVYEATESLKYNPNSKLLLTTLFISI